MPPKDALLYTQLVSLDRYNWELCLSIQVKPEQQNYVPSVLYSLAQSKFEQLIPYGVQYGDQMVGLLMYGEFTGICWINRVIIDRNFQDMGIGKQAVLLLLDISKNNYRCKEIRASYSRFNETARHLFESVGFEKINEALEEEEVVVYKGKT